MWYKRFARQSCQISRRKCALTLVLVFASELIHGFCDVLIASPWALMVLTVFRIVVLTVWYGISLSVVRDTDWPPHDTQKKKKPPPPPNNNNNNNNNNSTCFGQTYCLDTVFTATGFFFILVMCLCYPLELHANLASTVNINSTTNTSFCEYSNKTPDDGQ
jgi:hypothetical protein